MAPQTQMPSLMDSVESDAQRTAASGGGGNGKGPKRSFREALSDALSGGGGMAILAFIVIAGIGVAIFQGAEFAEQNNPVYPRYRVMNPDTGEMRWHDWRPGNRIPQGFFIVEYCFENQCGPAGGTPVVLNEYLGLEGDTNCPVCNALVVGHNPRPEEYEGVTPADQR